MVLKGERPRRWREIICVIGCRKRVSPRSTFFQQGLQLAGRGAPKWYLGKFGYVPLYPRVQNCLPIHKTCTRYAHECKPYTPWRKPQASRAALTLIFLNGRFARITLRWVRTRAPNRRRNTAVPCNFWVRTCTRQTQDCLLIHFCSVPRYKTRT